MTTTYWMGGEDVSFANISLTTGTGGPYRSAFSRGGIYAGFVNPDTSFPLTHYATTPQFGPSSSFWVHGQFGVNSGANGTTNGGILLVLYDASANPRLVVRGTGTAGQIKISTVNNSLAFVDLVTSGAGAVNFDEPNTDPCAFDFFVAYSVTGRATVYWNGIAICDTGPSVDVTTNGVTALGAVSFGIMTPSGNFNGWSECIIQDTSTLGMALQTLPPVATGNTQSWTGSVGNIDELAINIANFNYTTSNNEVSEWTVNTSLPTGTWSIVAVGQSAALQRGSTGPAHFSWDVRTSAAVSYTSGTIALSTGFYYYQGVWQENPNTSAPWTAGQLINSGIESLA